MPRILVHRFSVPAEVIDVNNHVNNLAYLPWMLDVAIRHTAARGWPMERYLAIRAGWVVRSHFIEYLTPAFLGEELVLLTWVSGLRGRSSTRKYLFWRPADRQAVVRGETVWVWVDGRTGRPAAIPEEVRNAFEIVPEDEDVLAVLEGAGA